MFIREYDTSREKAVLVQVKGAHESSAVENYEDLLDTFRLSKVHVYPRRCV